MNEYEIENYLNPTLPYLKFADKLRIGHLIFDFKMKRVVKVNMKILKEINLEDELNTKFFDRRFRPIELTKKWLTDIFCFNAKNNARNSLIVYTSSRNGLIIHEQIGTFFLASKMVEKIGENGIHRTKPKVIFINELMDYLFLIKRDDYKWTDADLKRINERIVKD